MLRFVFLREVLRALLTCMAGEGAGWKPALHWQESTCEGNILRKVGQKMKKKASPSGNAFFNLYLLY
jgi:hypothetical protein